MHSYGSMHNQLLRRCVCNTNKYTDDRTGWRIVYRDDGNHRTSTGKKD